MVAKTQVSEVGAWRKTVTGVGLGRKLYTYERGGKLYATGPKGFEVIGEGYNTAHLMADGTDEGSLFAIENDGTLYRIDPSDGEWEQIGQDGAWSDVVAADAAGGSVYYVDDTGKLWGRNVDTNEVIELGEGYDTAALWYWQGNVFVLENDGTLYKVDAESGEWERHGDEGAYGDTVAATLHEGTLYAVEDDGNLGATDVETGAYEEHDDEDFSDVRHLFSAGGALYAIDNPGTLYRVELD